MWGQYWYFITRVLISEFSNLHFSTCWGCAERPTTRTHRKRFIRLQHWLCLLSRGRRFKIIYNNYYGRSYSDESTFAYAVLSMSLSPGIDTVYIHILLLREKKVNIFYIPHLHRQYSVFTFLISKSYKYRKGTKDSRNVTPTEASCRRLKSTDRWWEELRFNYLICRSCGAKLEPRPLPPTGSTRLDPDGTKHPMKPCQFYWTNSR